MQYSRVTPAARALALSAGLLIAGTALAAPVSNNNQEAADCASRANLQFSIEDAQCAMYPTIAPAYGECKVRAVQNYGAALAKCSELAAAPGGRQTGVTGVDTISPGSDAGKPGTRKFREPAVQLQQRAP